MELDNHNHVPHTTEEMSGSEPIRPFMDRRAVDEEAGSLETVRAVLIAAVDLSQAGSCCC